MKACALLREHLGEEGIAPDVVLCSSAVRAVQTLDGVRQALPPDTRAEIEDGLYGAGADSLLRRLRELPEDVGSALLVGHNPGIEDLAVRLAGRGEGKALERMRSKYPTGGLATLAFDGAWRDLDWEAASLEAFVVPKDLG